MNQPQSTPHPDASSLLTEPLSAVGPANEISPDLGGSGAKNQALNLEVSAEVLPVLLQGLEPDCQPGSSLLHPILNAIADPLSVKDQQGRWCFLNEAYCSLVGYSQEVLLGQSETAIFSAPEAEPFLEADRQVLTTGQAHEQEASFTDASGHQRLVLRKTALLPSAAGSLLLVSTLQEITQHREAERRLQRQADRNQLLAAIAQCLLQSFSPEQLLQTTVSAVRCFLQVDRVLFYSFDADYKGIVAESVGDTVPRLASLPPEQACFIPEDVTCYHRGQLQAVAEVASAGLPAAHLKQLRRHGIQAYLVLPIFEGETLHGLICAHQCRSARPWQDWEVETLNEVVAQIGSAVKQAKLIQQVHQLNAVLERQVAQRTQQLQTALEFEATLKRITDRVRDSLDQKQIMLTAVKELTEALGVKGSNTALYDLEQGTSTIYYEYNRSLPSYQGRVAQMEAFPEVYHQLLEGQYFQFCSKEPNPVRGHVAMLACPILDDRGVLGDLWLIKDKDSGFNELEIRLVQQVANQCAIAIRQARLYQAAQSQVEELERLNRLKDDFLSTVSHELRTPVTSMRVALQLLGVTLNQEFDLNAELQKPKLEQARLARYYLILQEECEREISLINDLLDLQRLDVGNHPIYPEAVVLPQWLPDLVNGFGERAKSRQQSLTLVLADDLPVLQTDLASLERVLAELLNNACKYTPPGEQISLEVIPLLAAEADQVSFRLTNTGIEIPAAELPRIFDKFYRVPSADPWKQGGTGLGLALIQKLVMYLGGEVVVESQDQKTTFTVNLPRQLSPHPMTVLRQ
ncbi:MAG: GAF domain-containing protein [Cyanobacteria bacterium Co-bin13]|nr:GAF domain-containing protein [Cyanobacteria bacterium Co-bin13]